MTSGSGRPLLRDIYFAEIVLWPFCDDKLEILISLSPARLLFRGKSQTLGSGDR